MFALFAAALIFVLTGAGCRSESSVGLKKDLLAPGWTAGASFLARAATTDEAARTAVEAYKQAASRPADRNSEKISPASTPVPAEKLTAVPSPAPATPPPPRPSIYDLLPARSETPPVAPPSPPVIREVPPASSESSAACAHLFFPLRAGHHLGYRAEAGGERKDFTLDVGATASGRTTLRYVLNFAKLEIEQAVLCQAGAIKAVGYIDLLPILAGRYSQARTDKVSGDLLPKDLAVGQKWLVSYDTTAIFGGTGPSAATAGIISRIQIKNEVIGQEQIKVMAGSYEALRIRVTTISAEFLPGISVPRKTDTGVYYQWWAKGVGLVRQADENDKTVFEAMEAR